MMGDKSSHLSQKGVSKLSVLIVGVVVIAFFSVALSLWIYHRDGTAELDLSSPRYNDVRSKIEYNGVREDFSSFGGLTNDDVDGFLKTYDEHTAQVRESRVFGGEALSDDALGITSLFESE